MSQTNNNNEFIIKIRYNDDKKIIKEKMNYN